MSADTPPWTIEYVLGDVTRQDTDAIVNAANRTLGGGGGVDGAIHRAAGPELLRACLAIPQVAPGVRCPTGEARITPGFALPARFVIHTVGPVYDFDTAETCDALLADAHRSVLSLAEAHGLCSIALPAVSCGVYGFPFARAGAVVRGVLRAWTPRSLTLVRFVFPFERDWREFCRKRE